MSLVHAPYGPRRAVRAHASDVGWVPVVARRSAPVPVILALLAGFTVPLKAARLDVAGLSLYAAFVIVGIVATLYWREVARYFRMWFFGPMFVVTGFALWAVARGTGPVQPAVTVAKIFVAFVIACGFAALGKRAELWLHRGLLGGSILSVTYMAYQTISAVFFGFGLPFTAWGRFNIGFGLSQRYGLTRVTGFTEEPSFIATILVGATLLNIAYGYRSGRMAFVRVPAVVGALGLAMAVSNNLLASSVIIAGFWPFIRNRRVGLLFATYYFAALVATPILLTRDGTFFARLSAYDIFLKSGPIEWLFGRGIGSYPQFFEMNNIQFRGVGVSSLASIWGGFIFEGGVLLVTLVIFWIARIVRSTGWREGLAFVAILLMLSNFNSPWWPIVSLALAQCLVHQRKEHTWTTRSTSTDTSPAFGEASG